MEQGEVKLMQPHDLVVVAGGIGAFIGILAVAVVLAISASLIGLAITANANSR